MEELENILLRHTINICLLQETFWKRRMSFSMNNYKIYRSDRAGVRGGGTAIAVHNSIAAAVVPIKELAGLSILEATAVMISLTGGHKLFCLSVYNRNDRRRITPELSAILDKLCLDRHVHQYVVGGDFNALHQAWGFRTTYTRGSELFNFLNVSRPAFGCRVLASSLPSRPQTQSYPDLFIIKDTVDVAPMDDGDYFSDHRMLVLDCEVARDEHTSAGRVTLRE